MRKERFSWIMLIGSIVAGLIYGVIGELLYRVLMEMLPSVLVTAIYFTGLFLFLGFAVYMIGKMVYSRSHWAVNKKQWLAALLLIIGLSVLLEFIYDLVQQKAKETKIASYLFVIDNSGSMESNDPEGIRYQAIDKILEDKPDDFEYGIYSFADNAEMIRNMEAKSRGNDYGEIINSGETAIRGTLTSIMSDIESGMLDPGNNCRIILMSDGYATDVNFFNKYACTQILDQYAKKGISISTVGLFNADDELMGLIADKTGGVYISVDRIEQLEEGMRQAGEGGEASRNLLGYRNGSFANLLFAVMRIAFVMILGVVIAFEKTVLCEKFVNTTTVLISSIAGSILAGVCLEAGMNLIGIHPALMRIITCILISFTLLRRNPFLQGSDNDIVCYAGGEEGR